MKKKCIRLIKLFFSGAVSIILLSVFCEIYSFSGCHIRNTDGSTDYKWEPNQYMSTMVEGFSWMHFDRNGFNNENDASFDIQPIDILVMGSSHMEAMQVKKSENTAALLNQLLPQYRTYNIGTAGHTIYTCVQNMEAASKQYAPRKYVVLETADINLDETLMSEVINGSYPEIPSYDSGVLYWIQKTIPLVKIMYKNVQDWISLSSWNKYSSIEPVLETNKVPEGVAYEETLNRFLGKAGASIPAGTELIIFYHPTEKLDANGNLSIDKSVALELFRRQCEINNITFVDTSNAFLNLYETKRTLAYGFSNTAIGVGHLNKYGHEAISKALVDTIAHLEG